MRRDRLAWGAVSCWCAGPGVAGWNDACDACCRRLVRFELLPLRLWWQTWGTAEAVRLYMLDSVMLLWWGADTLAANVLKFTVSEKGLLGDSCHRKRLLPVTQWIFWWIYAIVLKCLALGWSSLPSGGFSRLAKSMAHFWFAFQGLPWIPDWENCEKFWICLRCGNSRFSHCSLNLSFY